LQYQAGLAALKLIDVHLAARDLFDFQARWWALPIMQLRHLGSFAVLAAVLSWIWSWPASFRICLNAQWLRQPCQWSTS
jgi:hypothetical protein